uniref:NadR/Ttd14 AAA domain-containing protein n=1 Tax=Acrobeloides nanus TaxID=290746 RepID=A0A914EEF7_9BILA
MQVGIQVENKIFCGPSQGLPQSLATTDPQFERVATSRRSKDEKPRYKKSSRSIDDHKNSKSVTSDYFSGSEEPVGSTVSINSTTQVPSEKPAKRLERRATFHPAEILANTIASTNNSRSRVFHMCEPDPSKPQKSRVYKLVLTGGPCGGKTTGQSRLAAFFESIGWKVFTVPEAATVLLNGGVKFAELSKEAAFGFQRDLLLTLLQLEKVFFTQASLVQNKNVLVICDRGAMDPSAYIDKEGWERILRECNLDQFDLRENRYNQVIHMVTAADGAEKYYTLSNNTARAESMLTQACQLDEFTRSAWLGHPYVDIVDNSDCISFEDKILKVLQVVCDRVGIAYNDRFAKNSKKRKWLIRSFDEKDFPRYEEFFITHDYLLADKPDLQVRIRERRQNNRSTYTITTRTLMKPEPVETRMQITEREYNRYLSMKDNGRATLFKRRLCFQFHTTFFHLDIFTDPLPPACKGQPIMILETYTTKPVGDPEPLLPSCLDVVREVTGDAKYSMYSLAAVSQKPSFNGIHFDN